MNEFEKWWASKSPLYRPKDIEELELYANTAYLAGAAAMREKCAGMTDKFTLGRYRENEYEFDLMTERIAAAIRKIDVG